jgi:hypothetical protein
MCEKKLSCEGETTEIAAWFLPLPTFNRHQAFQLDDDVMGTITSGDLAGLAADDEKAS